MKNNIKRNIIIAVVIILILLIIGIAVGIFVYKRMNSFDFVGYGLGHGDVYVEQDNSGSSEVNSFKDQIITLIIDEDLKPGQEIHFDLDAVMESFPAKAVPPRYKIVDSEKHVFHVDKQFYDSFAFHNEDLELLDLNAKDDYEQNHLEGAKNISLDDLEPFAESKENKDIILYIYSKNKENLDRVATELTKLGFEIIFCFQH